MKLKVDNDALAEEFFEGIRLVGIVCPQKDFQFCWHVNQYLQIDFRINHDLEVCLSRKGRNYFFSIYQFNEPIGSLVHYLYNNQYDGEFLLPEFRHFDFIWLMRDDIIDEAFMAELLNAIRLLPGVQLVSEISPEKVKNKSHLIV